MDRLTEIQIDVRTIEPRHKHPTIFKAWTDLPKDGSILLINDHDPVPLYYQFACEYLGEFRWEYLEQGPVWRVRISKGDFPDPGFKPQRKATAPVAAPIEFVQPLVLDTRPIFARGETPCQAIDDAVAKVITGQSLVLLVPFEPVPLYGKLEHEGFAHETARLEDGTYRIEFKRTQAAASPQVSCCH